MNDGPSSRTGVRARSLFLAFAAALAVGTHWPNLKVGTRLVERPDLLIHVTLFGAWSFLCARSAWFGHRFSARNVLLTALVSVAYCSLDEATQAIEIVHRTARWDDLTADLFGVAVGLGATLLLAAIDGGEPASEARHG